MQKFKCHKEGIHESSSPESFMSDYLLLINFSEQILLCEIDLHFFVHLE
mgnify:CR=1 FL=1